MKHADLPDTSEHLKMRSDRQQEKKNSVRGGTEANGATANRQQINSVVVTGDNYI